MAFRDPLEVPDILDPPEVPDILEETLGELAFAMEASSQATCGGVISTSSGASAERGEKIR
jgi:hypothetical protein